MIYATMKFRDIQKILSGMSPDEWRELEKKSGVPFSTIKKIGYKQTLSPRVDTIDALEPHLVKIVA